MTIHSANPDRSPPVTTEPTSTVTVIYPPDGRDPFWSADPPEVLARRYRADKGWRLEPRPPTRKDPT